jgi:hypothetical protein
MANDPLETPPGRSAAHRRSPYCGRKIPVGALLIRFRNLLCVHRRCSLRFGGFAQRSAAQEHGAFPLHAVGLERDAGAYSRLTLCRPTRIRRQGSEPDDGDYRQPERQGRSKRGATIDPQGFDAGKKSRGASAISWSIREAASSPVVSLASKPTASDPRPLDAAGAPGDASAL